MDLVGASEIERIVGVRRHPSKHYVRLISAIRTTYILHSAECLSTYGSSRLLECPWSLALERSNVSSLFLQDVPMVALVGGDCLVPDPNDRPASSSISDVLTWLDA